MTTASNDSVHQAQKVMLEILDAFDRVCRKHRLTYWLDHGTLLGAVRHQGFIPWDDDLDVTMPREDYERFLEIAPEELGEEFFLQTQTTDMGYLNFFAKIRHRGSTFIDAWEAERDIKYHQGIYIDIFPLNRINKNRWNVAIYKQIVWVSKLLHNRYIKTRFPTRIWVALLNRFHDPSGDFVVSGGENMHYVIHVDARIVFPLSQGEFEGKMYPVPHDAAAYLSSIFGEDYMQLPPEDQRKMHSVHIDIDTPCKMEQKDE